MRFRISGASVALLVVAMFSSGCAIFTRREAASATPVFEPLEFFAGRTVSAGIFESPVGKPRENFTATGWGRMERGTLRLSQSFIYEAGHTQRRDWRFRKIDARHYEGTASDVVGIAKGERRGNTFYLHYTVARKAGNVLGNVGVRQTMQLRPDGSVASRVVLSKLGIKVAAVTERFERAAGTPKPVRSSRHHARH